MTQESYLDGLPEDLIAEINAIDPDEGTQAAEQALDDADPSADTQAEPDGDATDTAKAPAPAAAPAPTPAQSPQDTDAAIKAAEAAKRAARHGERHAKTQLEKAQARIRELEAKVKTAPPEPDEAEQAIADLEADFPGSPAVKAFKKQQEELAALRATQAKTNEPDTSEFVPPSVDPELQDVLDRMPTLLDWQTDPNNREPWEKLVQADALLSQSPAWKDKPYAERFAKAEQLAREMLGLPADATPSGKSTTSPPAPKPVAPAPSARPSLSDFNAAAPSSGEFDALPDANMMDAAMAMDTRELERMVGINT